MAQNIDVVTTRHTDPSDGQEYVIRVTWLKLLAGSPASVCDRRIKRIEVTTSDGIEITGDEVLLIARRCGYIV